MRIVNPFGKKPLMANSLGIVPLSCICSSGSNNILHDFGHGSNCACKCRPDRQMNSSANYDMALS
ncbi:MULTISPECIES: hypothetical protein [Paenibacillus]|uniref:hypothetical protein n=1 Tax=Paenibacillus TaxID=44249 RepID=UPI000B086E6B|nr:MULTISPECIES: hypothetical protein [Paenibacillus]MBU9707783.1 hypothetical protein [Paenibacillus sp. AK121]MEE4567914.1 hypothetical protein [Paenibacillus polymyxa]WPQ55823.1 hypothetical protein SKN87_19930 [Paenibacillus polymyxa]